MNVSEARNLSGRLKSEEEIFDWIRTHIRHGSIFQDSEGRLMTADQVLVFQQGSFKDQAVLAYTLLKHKGLDPVIKIAADNAFIEVNDRVYDFKKGRNVYTISAEILMTLS
jgi:hypothetical protein